MDGHQTSQYCLLKRREQADATRRRVVEWQRGVSCNVDSGKTKEDKGNGSDAEEDGDVDEDEGRNIPPKDTGWEGNGGPGGNGPGRNGPGGDGTGGGGPPAGMNQQPVAVS